MIMTVCRRPCFRFALVVALAWCMPGTAQEPGKAKDDALDSLIEKLAGPDKGDKPAAKDEDAAKSKPATDGASEKTEAAGKAKADRPQAGKSSAPKPGSGDVSSKDKELDELLEKLGETKDEPSAPERPQGRPQPGDNPEPPRPGPGGADKSKEKTKGAGPQGKDKELDERLEELAGKKRKKNRPEQEQGGSPLGQIVKEMRDVEERLGKPDTGSDTQGKQKQIVKQIETLIQQMKESQGGQSGMAMRKTQQAGQKPGGQQGQTPGANARGAPSTKPEKPSNRHSLAGGKDIWGHLPPELRQEMDNVFDEQALEGKEDLIRRYYMSVARRKVVRGE
jgi:hypothetical protein